MKIGTCETPDPVTGSYVRGTDCPLDERTIFVAIASYRDYQCRYTVESIFTRAKNPRRIRIGTSQSEQWSMVKVKCIFTNCVAETRSR